jgi:uncharacterized protein YqeY
VSKAITDAMKARDQMTLGTLRMLKSALTMKEVEKGRGLEPAEDLQVVASMVKQRRDSIEQFTKGNRLDLARRRHKRLPSSSVSSHRPPAPTRSPRRSRLPYAQRGFFAKDFGKVMKAAMAELAGKTADGKAVSEAVRKRLS